MIKLLVDLNLSPDWTPALKKHGWETLHWSSVGDPRATDREIMAWAREHQFVVLTNDLDFGTILALTQAIGPSVIQIRAQDVLPAHLEASLVDSIRRYEQLITAGAIVTVDELRGRVRVLPIRRSTGS